MENDYSLRKKIIKRVAIVFVIVLLLLTFFSNTIMNYSLPEVMTVPVYKGRVKELVSCQGMVMEENGEFLLSAPVGIEDCQLIMVGVDAQVSNDWTGEMKARVKDVQPDPENPNRGRIVTFVIKGNVKAESFIQLTITGNMGEFPTVVPNSAVREDSEGKFVLVTTARQTPLGNRYYVKKVKVKVLASDAQNTAVDGQIGELDNVVTNTSKPVSDGQQVRLSQVTTK